MRRAARRARRLRLVRAGALALVMLALARGLAWAHAALLSSEPKANATLATSPPRIRLVFSEELEPTLGRIALEGADGRARPLAAKGDPHDVHALIAPIDSTLAPGAYRVIWRVVSADGHPVEGSYVFHVAAGAGSAAAHVPAPPPPEVSTLPGGASAPVAGPTVGGAPLVPSLLRGAGLGALMALGGLLFFVVGERSDVAPGRTRRAAAWLAVVAPLLLAVHALAWIAHTSPTQGLDASWVRATLGTTTGRVELARVVLALLACWALLLARRAGLALAFAAAALVVSGAVGHSAALHPAWTVPAKVVHLLAGALWAGGIVWLLALDRDEAATFAARAERMSSVALGAVIAVALSGVVQTALFLESPLDLVRSVYGAVVLAKVAGLLVLAGFGAYYRQRVIARLGESAAVRAAFGRLLGRELVVMAAVILLGGLLAYLAPPMRMPMTTRAPAHAAPLPHSVGT